MKRAPAVVLARVVTLIAALIAARGPAQPVAEWTARGSASLGNPGVLVVIDSLENQLATTGGQRTIDLVVQAGLLNPQGLAAGGWSQLSASLETEPADALNRIFGSRAVVAFASYGLPMPGDWFVATTVSRGDASRVLKGLNAVHRGVLAGATVFSIERGAYQICVLKQGGDTRLLVLGPGRSASGGVFEQAVRGLQTPQGGEWFASDWPIDEAGGVLLRVAAADADENNASLVYGHTTETGWSGVAVARNRLPADVPTWSAQDARAMVADASLGMVGSVTAASIASSPLAPFIGLNRDAARSVLGDGSRRGVVRLVSHDTGRATVSIAMETESARATQTDSLMRMLVAVVTGRPREAPDFAGRHPSAARCARLGGGFSEQLGRLVLGDQPRVCWQSAGSGEADPGRLAVLIGSCDTDAGALSGSLAAMRGVAAGPLVSAGRLEPGPIAAMVERAAGLERPVLQWASGIESIAWQTRRSGEDRVKAEFEIVLRAGDKGIPGPGGE